MPIARASSLATLALLALAPAAAAEPPPVDLRLPLVVHLTRHDGRPVIPPGDVPLLLEAVNGFYREGGICFALAGVRELDRSGDLRTYRERHSFVPFLEPGAINVFLVHSIYDPHTSESTLRTAARFGFKPDPWLDGAHIERGGARPYTYALVRAEAGARTVAHEVGHILGEGHSAAADNIMGYAAEPTRFDERQLKTFRARAQRELRSGALRRAARCGAAPES